MLEVFDRAQSKQPCDNGLSGVAFRHFDSVGAPICYARTYVGSIPGPHLPLSTLQASRCRHTHMTRGQCGSLNLHCAAQATATPCQLAGASEKFLALTRRYITAAPKFACWHRTSIFQRVRSSNSYDSFSDDLPRKKIFQKNIVADNKKNQTKLKGQIRQFMSENLKTGTNWRKIPQLANR